MNAQVAERERQAFVETTPAPKSNVVPYRELAAPKAYPPKIAKALLAVTRGIDAIGKHGENTFHKYHYQKWEDVLNAISPLLTEHGLILQQSEVGRCLFENEQLMSITYDFTIINEDGDVWPDRPVWTAISRARDQKGVPDDKAANKAHTAAHKYFLLHLFKIKTAEAAEDDADASDAPQATAKPKPPKPGSAEAQALDAPHAIPTNGLTADAWTDAFVQAIKDTSPEEREKWFEANISTIGKLSAPQFAEQKKRIDALYPAKQSASPVSTGQSAPPKPPRPEAAAATPETPDPATDGPGWIKWLTEKMASFAAYDEGSEFWGTRIEVLDLPSDTQQEAMGVWRRFEERFT